MVPLPAEQLIRPANDVKLLGWYPSDKSKQITAGVLHDIEIRRRNHTGIDRPVIENPDRCDVCDRREVTHELI
jgi:hypothetical protein